MIWSSTVSSRRHKELEHLESYGLVAKAADGRPQALADLDLDGKCLDVVAMTVAPSYARARSSLAKETGLGRERHRH